MSKNCGLRIWLSIQNISFIQSDKKRIHFFAVHCCAFLCLRFLNFFSLKFNLFVSIISQQLRAETVSRKDRTLISHSERTSILEHLKTQKHKDVEKIESNMARSPLFVSTLRVSRTFFTPKGGFLKKTVKLCMICTYSYMVSKQQNWLPILYFAYKVGQHLMLRSWF